MAARGFRAALRGKHQQTERVAPALLDVRAERFQRRKPYGGFGVARVGGVEQQGQRRRSAAAAPLSPMTRPLAELRDGVEIAALRGAGERVDGVVVAAGEIVLGCEVRAAFIAKSLAQTARDRTSRGASKCRAANRPHALPVVWALPIAQPRPFARS